MNEVPEIEEKLKINFPRIKEKLTDFINKKVREANADGVVFGLSGGIDSAVIAYLCQRTLENDNVLAVSMPEEGVTSKKDLKDSKKIVDELNIDFKTVQISSILEEFSNSIEDFDQEAKVPIANLKPRIRMSILYYYANLLNYLVVGTGNKSELQIGYFTKYGDGASDLIPLGSLYKNQVYKIAEKLGVPNEILEKEPSAGLWQGQTDESELGLGYDKIDRILIGLSLNFEKEKISEILDIPIEDVEVVIDKKESVEHKLQRPPIPEI
ncbi:MAG: NAD+ synthase [Hadesarchaea archaeon]|nr:NAD+ synthase [Hadesarchaea archaeon]